jgi:hypothetical protein
VWRFLVSGWINVSCKFRAISFALLTTASAVSCNLDSSKGKDKQGAGPQSPFLSLAEFTSDDLVPIESDMIGDYLNSVEEFVTEDFRESQESSSSACDRLVDSTEVSVIGDKMTVGFEIDFKECRQKDLLAAGISGYTIYEAKMRAYSEMQCEGEDLSAFDGKSFTELEKFEGTFCFKSRSLSHSEVVYKSTGPGPNPKVGSTQEEAPTETDVRTLKITGSSATSGCEVTLEGDVYTQVGSCLDYTLERRKAGQGDALHKLVTTGLTYKLADQYYRSGKISMDLYGWKGDMTYTGANTPPMWSLTKAGVTKTGTYSTEGSKSQTYDDKEQVSEPTTESTTESEGDLSTGLALKGKGNPSHFAPRIPGHILRIFKTR